MTPTDYWMECWHVVSLPHHRFQIEATLQVSTILYDLNLCTKANVPEPQVVEFQGCRLLAQLCSCFHNKCLNRTVFSSRVGE